MSLHEMAERSGYNRAVEAREAADGPGPRLWDAAPDVCCPAYQLGACPHTEGDGYDGDDTFDPAFPLDPPPAVTAVLTSLRERWAATDYGDDEPF